MATLRQTAQARRSTPSRITHHVPPPLVYLSTCLLVSLLLFEHLSVPLPLSDLRVPALYERVAAEPGDFALLELPPGWRNGARVAGKQDVVIMQQLWNQTSAWQAAAGRQHLAQPGVQVPVLQRRPDAGPADRADQRGRRAGQHDALREALAATPVTAEDRARARDLAAFLNLAM